jgi:hypothetical protein
MKVIDVVERLFKEEVIAIRDTKSKELDNHVLMCEQEDLQASKYYDRKVVKISPCVMFDGEKTYLEIYIE